MNFVVCLKCGTEIFVFCCLEKGIVEGYCKDCLLTLNPNNKQCSHCKTDICKKIEHMQNRLNNKLKPNTSGRDRRQPHHTILDINRQDRQYGQPFALNSKPPNPTEPLLMFSQESSEDLFGWKGSDRVSSIHTKTNGWQEVTEEQQYLAVEAMDAIDYRSIFEKERKKNGITYDPTASEWEGESRKSDFTQRSLRQLRWPNAME